MFSKKICRKNGKGADRDVWIWKKIPILKLRKKASNELIFLSDYIYRHVFLGYTQKQWDLIPEELDASVTARVPVYVSRDKRYFQDSYQAIPQNGYTDMFKNILNHPNIHILLNTDYREIIDDITFNKMIYSGPLTADNILNASLCNYIFNYKEYRKGLLSSLLCTGWWISHY